MIGACTASVLSACLVGVWMACCVGLGSRVNLLEATGVGPVRPTDDLFDFAGAASESSVSFDEDDEADDDGEADSELNTAATQDFPETDPTNLFNEDEDNYGDSVEAAASTRHEHLLGAGRRRVRRDADDRLMRRLLGRRRVGRAGQDKSKAAGPVKKEGDQEAAAKEDEADEAEIDSWVHDGVDDIQIDPETRQAASQLGGGGYDKSIDAEYEGQQGPRNRTRITTIAEVIPVDEERQSNSVLSRRVVDAPGVAATGAGQLIPAAYLSLEQVMELVGGRGARRPLASPARATARDELADWTAEGGSEPSTSDWSEPS